MKSSTEVGRWSLFVSPMLVEKRLELTYEEKRPISRVFDFVNIHRRHGSPKSNASTVLLDSHQPIFF